MDLVDDKIERLMQAEINIRDAIAKLEQEVKDLKAKREKIQSALNDICLNMKVDGLKTKVGTLTRGVKKRYWTDDWGSFYKFMMEHEVPELLEKRIAKGCYEEFMENNPGLAIPNVQALQEFSITIRRNKANDDKESDDE